MPPSTYDAFVQGYANTTSVFLIVQPPAFGEGAAGSLYVSIPTAIVATQRDGSTQIFADCYIMRKSILHPPDIPQEDVWHLYRAAITPSPVNAPIPALIAGGCAANT